MTDNKKLLEDHESELLQRWTEALETQDGRLIQALSKAERQQYGKEFLRQFIATLDQRQDANLEDAHFDKLRALLSDISAEFAARDLSPSETATYILSLKGAIFPLFQEHLAGDALVQSNWKIGAWIDQLGLYTFEAFSRARERILKSQAQALSELSTPVIQMWKGIIALPLVGAIDSNRAKEIMEKLLAAVVAHEADIVIIDITGVPVVDTQVANRLMRTVESVRLLGANSIITGVNPIIAQTLVQLGVDLGQLNTKASLRAGLQQAFRQLNLKVVFAKG